MVRAPCSPHRPVLNVGSAPKPAAALLPNQQLSPGCPGKPIPHPAVTVGTCTDFAAVDVYWKMQNLRKASQRASACCPSTLGRGTQACPSLQERVMGSWSPGPPHLHNAEPLIKKNGHVKGEQPSHSSNLGQPYHAVGASHRGQLSPQQNKHRAKVTCSKVIPPCDSPW